MSVPDTSSRHSYVGRGDTGPYAIDFDVILDDSGNATDIVVKLLTAAGVETDITSVCTITGLNVYTTASYDSTYHVVPVRYPAVTQPYTFAYKTDLPAKRIEEALDRAVYLIQRNSLDADLALKAPLSDATAPGRIPSRASRILQFLGFDASGDPMAGQPAGSPINVAWQAALAGASTDLINQAFGTFKKRDVSVDSTMVSSVRYRVLHGPPQASLTLPASPSVGDAVEVEALAACRILQSDAEHLIGSGRFFTTKGASGYLQLFPGTLLRLTYMGSMRRYLPPASWVKAAMTAPSQAPQGLATSLDNLYLGVSQGGGVSGSVDIYKKAGVTDSWSKLGSLPAPLANQERRIAFSRDGTYLAYANGTTSPFVQVWKRTPGTDTWSAVAALPAAAGALTGVGWIDAAYPSEYLVVYGATTPFIEVYKRTAGSDTFAKVSALTAAAGAANDLAVSADGTYAVLGGQTTPFLEVYKRYIDSWTKLSAFSALPGAAARVSISPDGTLLVATNTSSAALNVYRRALGSDSFSALAGPANAAAASGVLAMHPTGDRFAVFTSGNLEVYERSGNEGFDKSAGPAPNGAGAPVAATFSPCGGYLFDGGSTYLEFYTTYDLVAKGWLVEMLYTPNAVETQFMFR